MGISFRTRKKHEKVWRSATAVVNSLLEGADAPEHWFAIKAAKFDTSDFLDKSRRGINLSNLYIGIGWDLTFAASQWCDEAQRYMFRNHKWTNRTGDAEASVDAKIAGMKDDRLEVFLYHGVYYGRYLEYSHIRPFPIAGDVSIIPETLQVMSPKLAQNLQHILDK